MITNRQKTNILIKRRDWLLKRIVERRMSGLDTSWDDSEAEALDWVLDIIRRAQWSE